MISGFGRCSQRAGAEIARRSGSVHCLLSSEQHPDMLTFLQNLYVQALLARYQIIQVCIACQVVNMDGNALLARY